MTFPWTSLVIPAFLGSNHNNPKLFETFLFKWFQHSSINSIGHTLFCQASAKKLLRFRHSWDIFCQQRGVDWRTLT